MTRPNQPSGPHSSAHATDNPLGFDPDSPDADDPAVDPVGPAIAPLDKKPGEKGEESAKAYDPLADLKP